MGCVSSKTIQEPVSIVEELSVKNTTDEHVVDSTSDTNRAGGIAKEQSREAKNEPVLESSNPTILESLAAAHGHPSDGKELDPAVFESFNEKDLCVGPDVSDGPLTLVDKAYGAYRDMRAALDDRFTPQLWGDFVQFVSNLDCGCGGPPDLLSFGKKTEQSGAEVTEGLLTGAQTDRRQWLKWVTSSRAMDGEASAGQDNQETAGGQSSLTQEQQQADAVAWVPTKTTWWSAGIDALADQQQRIIASSTPAWSCCDNTLETIRREAVDGRLCFGAAEEPVRDDSSHRIACDLADRKPTWCRDAYNTPGQSCEEMPRSSSLKVDSDADKLDMPKGESTNDQAAANDETQPTVIRNDTLQRAAASGPLQPTQEEVASQEPSAPSVNNNGDDTAQAEQPQGEASSPGASGPAEACPREFAQLGA